MKKIVTIVLAALAMSLSASAQNYVTRLESKTVSAVANLSISGVNAGASIDYCFSASGRSALSFGATFLYGTYDVSEPDLREFADLWMVTEVTYHYGVSSSFEIFGQAGPAIEAYKQKNTNQDFMIGLLPDVAVGARLKLVGPVSIYARAGFPYSSLGLSVRF